MGLMAHCDLAGLELWFKMELTQNDREHLIDMVENGKITVAQANVEKVRMQRVLLVTKLPSQVRKVLNAAVKTGYLCHLKKDGHKPEVYYHPSFEYLVAGERNRHERFILNAALKVLG